MKNKLKTLISILAILALTAALFAACTPDDNKETHDFTITVIGVDDKPFTNVTVQPCLTDNTTCFNGKKVDGNGVATFDAKELTGHTDATELIIHIPDLPIYYTFDEPTLQKGKSVTIKLRYNLGQPEGNGNAKYVANTNQIDVSDGFTPYKVNVNDEVGYEIKFTSADQKIYFQFLGDTEYACIYAVYSVGDVDAKVIQLQGNTESGLSKPEDAKYTNDNVSDTDKNFRLEFSHDRTVLENSDSTSWFELSLSNAQDVNKTFIIVFEYIDDL